MCARIGARELSLGTDVEVRSSPGKGMGLYALRDLPAGTLVTRYTGETMTVDDYESKLDAGRTTGAYGYGLGGTWVVDAEDPRKSGWSRYVNHGVRRMNCEAISVRFRDLAGTRAWPLSLLDNSDMLPLSPFAVYFETVKDVTAGEEILYNYGDAYWSGMTGRASRYHPVRLIIDHLL